MVVDPPALLHPATRHVSSQSPTRQRVYDDILAQTSPVVAAEALRAPTDALARCMNDASAAEKDFAMRAAVASRNVWEWVDELEDWTWPDSGGPSGFERPRFASDEYVGCLPRGLLDDYEARIDEIYHCMDDLEVEDIKSHVLANHILPLSRPASPASDLGRKSAAAAAALSYNKMEDLTAVVTAIVVQMLPNLARLSGLLQMWTIRVSVLRMVPSLLAAVEDAEVALRSGWTALAPLPDGRTVGLSRRDFGVMKAVVEKKVSGPGRTLDYMLDRLEGHADTLPDHWLDRMESVERGYAEWVAAAERRVAESEWLMVSKASSVKGDGRAVAQDGQREAVTPSASTQGQVSTPPQHEPDTSLPEPSPAPSEPSPPLSEPAEGERVTLSPPIHGEAVVLPAPQRDHQEPDEPSKKTRDVLQTPKPSRKEAVAMQDAAGSPATPPPSEEASRLRFALDRTRVVEYEDSFRDGYSSRIQIPTPIKEERTPSPRKMSRRQPISPADSMEIPDVLVSPDTPGGGEPELPPLPVDEADDASDTSTVLHGESSHFGLSSEPPEISVSPGVSRSRVHQAAYVDENSPPSSPPMPESSTATRESSAAPPDISTTGDDAAAGNSPTDPTFSEIFDDSFSMSEIASPSIRGPTDDQHLRHQIGQIIQSIPAKIKLETEPPDLNPPDLQLPRLRKKTSREPVRRSASGMSSRGATPSFTLSPAKSNSRSRNRGQQEIKVYHLARSTGEAPIKLFIRCVGDNGERVMVRVGGGWADLSEYLKEYASHHGRRSGVGADPDSTRVEIRDIPRVPSGMMEARSTPPSRPASALETSSPTATTPLAVRKTRRSVGAMSSEVPRPLRRPNTPGGGYNRPSSRHASASEELVLPSSEERRPQSRSSSRLSWVEEDNSILGLAGPSGKKVEMSEENKAWVESVKEKVRIASGERRPPPPLPPQSQPQEEYGKGKFGELGRVGGTKRLFRRSDALSQSGRLSQNGRR